MVRLFLTWLSFGPWLALQASGSDDLDLEVTSAVAHAQLDVPERGRREYLASHQLTRPQTLDELGELTLGAESRGGGQPADC